MKRNGTLLFNAPLHDGDGQDLAKHADGSFDFLHSSHCLEHVREPSTALRNWIRVVRKFGHIVVMVPDEDMYEQGIWPSTFNNDHKHTFTICKQKSWSPVSRNVTDFLAIVADLAEPVRIEQLHLTFQRGIGRVDQTENPVGEIYWVRSRRFSLTPDSTQSTFHPSVARCSMASRVPRASVSAPR